MAEQRIHSSLAPIDVLTRLELEESLTKNLELAERTRVRGVDYMEQNGNGNNQASVAIPGPNSGYAWSVKMISAMLSAAGTLLVYLGDSILTAPVASVTTTAAGPAIVTWTSNIVIVRDGRTINLVASSATIGAWKTLSKQVPDEMIGKL